MNYYERVSVKESFFIYIWSIRKNTNCKLRGAKARYKSNNGIFGI